MKHFLYITALLAVSAVANGQMAFPSSNTIWTVRHGNGDTAASFYALALKTSDTTISGTTYHKLYKSDDMTFDESEYCGALREDGTHRVFYLPSGASAEKMIFNFSLVIGDTLWSQLSPGSPEGIVDHIDSVLIDGTWLMRWNFRMVDASAVWTGGAWVEGMGNSSLGGLFASPMLQPTCDCAENIICFGNNAGWYYHNSLYASSDCLPTTGISDKKLEPVQASVIPNPVLTNGKIILPAALSGSHNHVTITDVTGRAVADFTPAPGSDITLNGAQLHPGIYIYHIINETGIYANGRFVVK